MVDGKLATLVLVLASLNFTLNIPFDHVAPGVASVSVAKQSCGCVIRISMMFGESSAFPIADRYPFHGNNAVCVSCSPYGRLGYILTGVSLLTAPPGPAGPAAPDLAMRLVVSGIGSCTSSILKSSMNSDVALVSNRARSLSVPPRS